MTLADVDALVLRNLKTTVWIDEIDAAGQETKIEDVTLVQAIWLMNHAPEGHRMTDAVVILPSGEELDHSTANRLYRRYPQHFAVPPEHRRG
jgi:hypothetical protein